MDKDDYKSYDDVNTGITSEVFTMKSKLLIIDIINQIIDMKSQAVLEWINSFNPKIINKTEPIMIVGTYLTGIGIAKLLNKEGYSNITLLDIYPHLESFINSKLPYGLQEYDINFSNDLSLLKDAEKSLVKIAEATKKSDAICFVGLPYVYGGKLYNVAAVIQKGQVLALIPKKYMPNYEKYESG